MKNFFTFLTALSLCAAAGAQDFSVSANVLDYANMGTFNAELSYALSRHWSVGAGVLYNPFVFGSSADLKSNRQRSIVAGARYWPWHIYSGWWLAGRLRAQEYNTGGFTSPVTTEGGRFGGGVSGGYSYMLGPHFNLDFGIGVWGGYDIYTVYQCQVCGKITDKGNRFFVLPNDILLSLTYIF